MAKSFTQLVGNTTPGAYPGSFTDLSQNNSASNVSLGKALINTQHKYYLQKFFDNENSLSFITVGPQDLTLTGVLVTGATTGTLSSVWTYLTCQQLVVFSNSEQRTVRFTQGSAAISWLPALTSGATVSISTQGVQAYPLPANVSKIKNTTITIGQLQYTPSAVRSIQDWTYLNALPYNSDIVNQFFIYQNQLLFWPIPSSTGSVATLNYKSRVPDMTYADYAVGTISGATVGSNAITGTSTVWSAFPQNTDLSYINLMFKIDPPDGDGLWYPIQRFTSATAMTLNLPMVNVNELTSATYIIGQFPLLQEDFCDLLVYSSLAVYYSSIVKDSDKFKMYETLTKQREDMMTGYLADKSINVDLGESPASNNPNLFIFAQ